MSRFDVASRVILTMLRLNMRTAHGIYRTLQQFLEESDRDGYDDEIDMDFRSVRPFRAIKPGSSSDIRRVSCSERVHHL